MKRPNQLNNPMKSMINKYYFSIFITGIVFSLLISRKPFINNHKTNEFVMVKERNYYILSYWTTTFKLNDIDTIIKWYGPDKWYSNDTPITLLIYPYILNRRMKIGLFGINPTRTFMSHYGIYYILKFEDYSYNL